MENTEQTQKQEKKNKKLKAGIGAAIGTIAGSLVVAMLFNPPWKDNSFEGQMKKAAEEINKTCPVQLDEATRLDSASAVSAVGFNYYYTLDTTRMPMPMDSLRKYLPQHLITSVKNEPDMAAFRKNAVIVKYVYLGPGGDNLFEFAVTPAHYR